MKHHKGILFAGTFAGLLIIALLASAFGNLGVLANSGTDGIQEVDVRPLPQVTNLTADEALHAWQQYGAELEQTVRTMQDRENTYRSQMDLANQTIQQLQDQLNAVGRPAGIGGTIAEDNGFEEHEGHEDSNE